MKNFYIRFLFNLKCSNTRFMIVCLLCLLCVNSKNCNCLAKKNNKPMHEELDGLLESNQSKSLIKLHTPINQPKQYYSRSRYYSEKHDLVRHSRPYSRSYRYSNY